MGCEFLICPKIRPSQRVRDSFLYVAAGAADSSAVDCHSFSVGHFKLNTTVLGPAPSFYSHVRLRFVFCQIRLFCRAGH